MNTVWLPGPLDRLARLIEGVHALPCVAEDHARVPPRGLHGVGIPPHLEVRQTGDAGHKGTRLHPCPIEQLAQASIITGTPANDLERVEGLHVLVVLQFGNGG